jgi:nucleoside-diphosphate-sugar epimerase
MENLETVLVTGGSGFVGSHCVLQLLQKGYAVRTTVRSMQRKNEVLGMLRNGGITAFDRLTFVEADLNSDANWGEAAAGCRYVLHVASPLPSHMPKDEEEVIRPAVDGTLRVLKAAKKAGVKRVVVTSNFGAVGYSHKDPTTVITEKEWTDPNEKGLNAYSRSKVLAERAAWDFINKEGGGMELAVVNPVAILGPVLGPDMPSSFEMPKHLLAGSRMPKLNLNIVDVRDVADAHIRAMISPEAGGERFILLSGGTMTLQQMAAHLKKAMPGIAQKVTVKGLPNWVVRMAALFDARAKTIAPMLGVSRNVSNEKAKKVLNWQPMATNEQAVVAAVESMLKFGQLNVS